MRCDGVAAPGHAPPAEIGRRDLAIVCLGTEMNSLITQIAAHDDNNDPQIDARSVRNDVDHHTLHCYVAWPHTLVMGHLSSYHQTQTPSDTCTAKKTNERVLNNCKEGSLLDTVKARKLAYYGQTMRKQGSCLDKEIMQGTMPGARRRGRPRTAWMDNIKTWTGLPVEQSVRMTEDRDKWRW